MNAAFPASPSFRILARQEKLPFRSAWLLADLGEFKGLQELYKRSAPDAIKRLKESAIIESSISSNRIEGVSIDADRIVPVLQGQGSMRDRDEEEVRGYRRALDRIYESPESVPPTEEVIKSLHAMARGDIWDAGLYKERDNDIIEKYPDGRERIRFKTVAAKDIPEAMDALIGDYPFAIKDRVVHPLVALAALNLDFLCIHPFRDGNGRVSRLLLVLTLLQNGYEAGRYISIEGLIEQSKDRYYETLEQSSKGWHEGRHDPWPYIDYLLYTLKQAYDIFKVRAEGLVPRRGEKTARILEWIDGREGSFSVSMIRSACPEASLDLIRKTIKSLKAERKLEPLSFGRDAAWQKTDSWQYPVK